MGLKSDVNNDLLPWYRRIIIFLTKIIPFRDIPHTETLNVLKVELLQLPQATPLSV